MNSDYSWIPACGGTEKKFIHKGKYYLYMWNTQTKEHSYYCLTDDLFVDTIN